MTVNLEKLLLDFGLRRLRDMAHQGHAPHLLGEHFNNHLRVTNLRECNTMALVLINIPHVLGAKIRKIQSFKENI